VTSGLFFAISGVTGIASFVGFKYLSHYFVNDDGLIATIGLGSIVLAMLSLSWLSAPSMTESANYNSTNSPTEIVFIITVMMVHSVGYPLLSAASLGAFSKSSEAGPNAAQMGLFWTAGYLFRWLGPVAMAFIVPSSELLSEESSVSASVFLAALGIIAGLVSLGLYSSRSFLNFVTK
jgi:hypothetical protein